MVLYEPEDNKTKLFSLKQILNPQLCKGVQSLTKSYCTGVSVGTR